MGKSEAAAGGVDETVIEGYKDKIETIRGEIAKVVVGQEKVVNGLMTGLLCNGHILVEGVPGIAKTLLITTLARRFGRFS